MEGYLDGVRNGTTLHGWCWEPGSEEPLVVEIRVDGVVVGTIMANEYRADLEEAGKRHGRFAFSYVVPADLATSAHQLDVVVAATGQPLNGSPLLFLGPGGQEPAAASVPAKASLWPLSRLAGHALPSETIDRICQRLLRAGLIPEFTEFVQGLDAAGELQNRLARYRTLVRIANAPSIETILTEVKGQSLDPGETELIMSDWRRRNETSATAAARA